ncbi:MAG: YceI family protein [Flavobacteriaceae bacterium]|nr:YceI family protein [Flavobacteriaceae bacterium]
MKTLQNFSWTFGSLFIFILTTQISVAQTFKVNNSASRMEVLGTSNIHDWEILAKDFQGTINLELENGQLVKISQLDFSVIAESLESGKGGMDNNTYKALNTDKYKTIIYKLVKVNNIDRTSNNQCKITASGYLTIAGTKKPIDITFDSKISDGNIVLSGNKAIKMSNFNIDAPTALFGTITTGDEVNIKFQAVFTKIQSKTNNQYSI